MSVVHVIYSLVVAYKETFPEVKLLSVVFLGDKINIYLTSPDIGVYSFSWSVVEGGNLCFFNKSSKMAHLEVYSSASLGTRIRIKVEADIPASDYYICQYLNFYVY